MVSMIDWPRALLRGRYSIAAARSEHLGVPIDEEILASLVEGGPALRNQLIEIVDKDYGVYEGTSFRVARFGRYLDQHGIVWPVTATGRLSLDDDTFKEMARAYPQLADLRQLRQTLAQLRELKLTVGDDGRNRYALHPFSSTTGRNQPSTNRSVFGLSAWLRGLIRPESGTALAYVDFGQQELAIAAALSGDLAMQKAYRSGDFYIAFAIQAGAVPPSATKATHPVERERFKQCALGVLYGMEDVGLARRLGISVLDARQLLAAHRRTYATFWRWSNAIVDHAMLTGKLQTAFGWALHTQRDTKARTLRNFPMQANGAEMLRIACIGLVEAGIRVCAPVHDAVLIEAPIDEIGAAVGATQAILREASAIVLDGFEVTSEAKIVRHPDRFLEPKGIPMWNRVMALLGRDDALVEMEGT